MAENFFEEEINLRDYLRVLFKRRWLIATVLLIVVVSVTIETFRKTPIFRATAQVMIESDNPKVVDIEEVLQNNQDYFDYYQTQYGILKSKALALKVIKFLNLNENPEFGGSKKGFSLGAVFHGMIGWLKNLTSSAEAKPDPQLQEDRKNNSLIGAYLGRLRVEPIQKQPPGQYKCRRYRPQNGSQDRQCPCSALHREQHRKKICCRSGSRELA